MERDSTLSNDNNVKFSCMYCNGTSINWTVTLTCKRKHDSGKYRRFATTIPANSQVKEILKSNVGKRHFEIQCLVKEISKSDVW